MGVVAVITEVVCAAALCARRFDKTLDLGLGLVALQKGPIVGTC